MPTVRGRAAILVMALVSCMRSDPGDPEGVTGPAVVIPPPPPSPARPTFQSRTCDVKDSGAEGDGDADYSDAISEGKSAINAFQIADGAGSTNCGTA